MSSGELDAAGITEPALRRAYARCRSLNARHGKTYFLATRLLTKEQRPAVHALYGFARWADDLVDEPGNGDHTEEIIQQLDDLGDALFSGLESGHCEHPIVAAVVDTARRYRIDSSLFADFLRSMRMDLTVDSYPNRAALDEYMRGSAEVIGLQMLPVLGTVSASADAQPRAAALGKAFQLTNFLRDVAEDLDRGRVYLPADELAEYGVERDLLYWCRRNRRTDPRVRAALAAQHANTRALYQYAQSGVAMLSRRSRPCINTALKLYSGILDNIEESEFAVFAGRARVSKARRVQMAASALPRSWWARRGQPGFGLGRVTKREA